MSDDHQPTAKSFQSLPLTPQDGQTMLKAARISGLSYRTLWGYVHKGVSPESALKRAVSRLHSGCVAKDHLGNRYPSIAAMARAYGLIGPTLNSRLNAGWDVKKALTTPVRGKQKKDISGG